MKTYLLNNSDKQSLLSFKSAFEGYNLAKEKGDVTFINHAHNWLQSIWYDVGTALRKSGFDIANREKSHNNQAIYNHICALNLLK